MPSRLSSFARSQAPDDEASLNGVRADVEALCRKFPLYPALAR